MGLLFLRLLDIFHVLLRMMLSKRVMGVVRTSGQEGRQVMEGWHAGMTNWRATRSGTRTGRGRKRRWPTNVTKPSTRVG